MSLSALGPQLTYLTIIDRNADQEETVGIISAKVHNSSESDDWESSNDNASGDIGDILTRQVLNGYSRHIRSGDSSLFAFLKLLRNQLEHKDLAGLDAADITIALNLVAVQYQRVIEACALSFSGSDWRCAPAVANSRSREQSRSTATEASEAGVEDDTDWFFDSVSAPQPAILTPTSALHSPTAVPTHAESLVTLGSLFEIATNEWFGQSLEHCDRHDFSSSMKSPPSSLSLPMRLVLTSMGLEDCAYSIRDRLLATSLARERSNSNMLDTSQLRAIRTGGLLTVQLVGQLSTHSCAVSDGLIVPLSVDSFDRLQRALQAQYVTNNDKQMRQQQEQQFEATKATSSTCDSDSDSDEEWYQQMRAIPNPSAIATTTTAITHQKQSSSFQAIGNKDIEVERMTTLCTNRIVLVDNTYLQEGQFGEGSDLSQDVKSVKVNNILQLPKQQTIASDYLNDFFQESNNSFQLYMNKCLLLLKSFRVNMILCNDSNIDKRISDAFAANQIAIVSVHSVYIACFAKLLSIDPVRDIISVTEKCVSASDLYMHIRSVCQFNAERCKVLFRCNLDTFPTNSVNRLEYTFHYDQKRQQPPTRGEGRSRSNDESINAGNCVMVAFEIERKHYQQNNVFDGIEGTDNSIGSKISSLLIVAPSEAAVVAIEDRTSRCLYRLKALLEGYCAVGKGAGLVEVLAYAQLQHIQHLILASPTSASLIRQLLKQEGVHDRDCPSYLENSAIEKDISLKSAILTMLDIVKEVLLQYVVVIGTNNGFEVISSVAKFFECVNDVQNQRERHKLHSSDVTVDIPSWLQAVSDHQKLSLRGPLDALVSQASSTTVLDVLPIKYHLFVMALSVASQLKRTHVIR